MAVQDKRGHGTEGVDSNLRDVSHHHVEGRRVLVEHIPAQVCQRCGEATFSRETAEKVRRQVHSETRPVRTVPLDVFALS
ncbi:MAG: YgiT-type zinc finger protein [Acidobacteria bacterium]|nr:YgiT-type zinc finger protein [Acidobacteriota bacterium]